MDASSAINKEKASTSVNLRSFYFHVENRGGKSKTANTNNTIIKFTKLPDYDFDSKVIWPQKNSYVLHPRLRRIVTLTDDDSFFTTSRSLKGELEPPQGLMSSTYSGRKIVTIAEDDDKHKEQLISKKKAQTRKVDSKLFSAKPQRESDVNLTPSITSSRFTSYSRYNNKPDTKLSAKSTALNSSKSNEHRNVKSTKTACQVSKVNIPNRGTKIQAMDSKTRISKEKEKSHASKSTNLFNKPPSNISKNTTHSNVSLLEVNSNMERKYSDIMSYRSTSRHMPIIKVPLEKASKKSVDSGVSRNISQVDCSTETEKSENHKEIGVGSDKEPERADVITEPDYGIVQKQHSVVQTDKFLFSNYDSLIIPNVTLLKDKNDESKEDIVKLCSKSLPDLQVPALEITTQKNGSGNKSSTGIISESKSYIIGRATLTYTTKQKIDFHVVSNKEEAVPSASSSPLAYPMNIVSVYKEELKKNKEADKILVEDDTKKKKNKFNSEQVRHGNELQSINCSYVFNNSKLVKPSELISTIRLNNGLIHNDYISEQFQRELNFIDSFFESLQYLENCSMSNKSFTDTSVEHWVSKSGFDLKGPEYDSLFSKFENDANIDDAETMASKSLCLLNLLIRDEQRRAKNLLFVLKMREDALKDFTKSQIIWLENKKKHDNIDIPTLKKKQRGALLKLQHECGEMQRMRKALLSLSEKRKVALLKTKKNIELKLKNNVVVQQMLLGKKKLKRSSTCERPTVPLKCFDLSSSGCEDSTASRPKSEAAIVAFNAEPAAVDLTTKSAEKSIQTGESLLNPTLVDESTEMAADNFVTVDGGYLNILFHNLLLPEIFSSGKKYELNEEALRSIVNSANNRNSSSGSEVIERFVDQIKNHDPDRSTTPSTARSLVEEFDQYYKGLVQDDQSPLGSPERKQEDKCKNSLSLSKETMVEDCAEVAIRSTDKESDDVLHVFENSEMQVSSETVSAIAPAIDVVENSKSTHIEDNKEAKTVTIQAGPLPVPAGAAAITDATSGLDTPPFVQAKSSCSSGSSSSAMSMSSPLTSLVLPVHSEAEELRRQQLAIEREIKALEQQQSQLLVVREIPDKPPPPYIPPAEARVPKPSRMFAVDDSVTQKVERILADPSSVSVEPTDQFNAFLQDFCEESVDKHKKNQGDKPWDACNLLPQKPPLTREELAKKTSGALKEVLAGVPTVLGPSVGARRSDHIDDILFAEWRCYEPQWTAHHTDEAAIKSQIFEGIFQRILTKTVDEYKKVVLGDGHASKSD